MIELTHAILVICLVLLVPHIVFRLEIRPVCERKYRLRSKYIPDDSVVCSLEYYSEDTIHLAGKSENTKEQPNTQTE